jgi:2-polyprenyl-3-methyl-5-hydroxy-6-metoxy-1,4-benzoquinol methylase
MEDLFHEERSKYRRIWGFPEYRKHSPGEAALNEALPFLSKGKTLVDLGCGTGRAAQSLQSKGFEVTGIDFAGNCLDENVDIHFIESCLWDLPKSLIFDVGYCTDVMEHIPKRKVHAVLRGIFDSTFYGCFFQIATFEDRFGSKIGEPLHLSVEPAERWAEALEKHWPYVKMLQGGRNARFWVEH